MCLLKNMNKDKIISIIIRMSFCFFVSSISLLIFVLLNTNSRITAGSAKKARKKEINIVNPSYDPANKSGYKERTKAIIVTDTM